MEPSCGFLVGKKVEETKHNGHNWQIKKEIIFSVLKEYGIFPLKEKKFLINERVVSRDWEGLIQPVSDNWDRKYLPTILF